MRFILSSLSDSWRIEKVSDYQQVNADFLNACRNRLGDRAVIDGLADDDTPFYQVSCTTAGNNQVEIYQIVIEELRAAGYDTENCQVVFLAD